MIKRSSIHMNPFWVLSLILTTVGVFFLLLFLIPFRTSTIQKIGSLVFKAWVPILSCCGVYILLFFQEKNRAASEQLKHQNAKLHGDEQYFYATTEMFKAQRNIYIISFGFTVIVSIVVIAWQVSSWGKKNDQLRARIDHAD